MKAASKISKCLWCLAHAKILNAAATMQSNVIYQFTCHCKGTYVGRTSQQLGERITQHIPAKLLSTPPPTSWQWTRSDSAITKHLKVNRTCLHQGITDSFRILARSRHQRHLEILEAAFIQSFTPSLCQQKDLSKYLLLGTWILHLISLSLSLSLTCVPCSHLFLRCCMFRVTIL